MTTANRSLDDVKAHMSSLVLRMLLQAQSPLVSATADALLRSMLELQPTLRLDGTGRFHAMFETLRAELLSVFVKKQSLTLGELYPGAQVSASDASRAMLEEEEIPLRMRELERVDHHVTKKLSKAWCKAHVNSVVVPASGNPGFDIAIPLDRDRLLVIDTTYSMACVDEAADPDFNLAKHVIASRNHLDACLRAISGAPLMFCRMFA